MKMSEVGATHHAGKVDSNNRVSTELFGLYTGAAYLIGHDVDLEAQYLKPPISVVSISSARV